MHLHICVYTIINITFSFSDYLPVRLSHRSHRLSRHHINAHFLNSKFRTFRFELYAEKTTPVRQNQYCQKIGDFSSFDPFLAIHDARQWSDMKTSGVSLDKFGKNNYNVMLDFQKLPSFGNLTNKVSSNNLVGAFWETWNRNFSGTPFASII